MFVNSIIFLVTFFKKIILFTVEHVPTNTIVHLDKYFINIVKLYAGGGFVIRLIIMDMEFVKIEDKVGLVEVNTTAAGEYVRKIESQIRLIK